MEEISVDIVIIGGGLTGATLLIALQSLGFKVLLIEAKALPTTTKTPHFDARSLALSPASVAILDMLGVWSYIAPRASAIDSIHVSHQGRFGSTCLNRDKANPLGYVVDMPVIYQALHQVLHSETIMAPAQFLSMTEDKTGVVIMAQGREQMIRAALIVAADGAESSVRQSLRVPATIKSYQQHAIVTNIGLDRPHGNQAFERFTRSGPQALLPLTGNRMSLVWSLTPELASQYKALNDAQFLAALTNVFGYRLGRLISVGERHCYPLKRMLLTKKVYGRVVFVGNAAHALHPIAGQGFNLGLRDVATLIECLSQSGITMAALDDYQLRRQPDEKAVVCFTDGLLNLFGSSLPGAGIGAGIGLALMDNSPYLQGVLSRLARGFAGNTPSLACGIPLIGRMS